MRPKPRCLICANDDWVAALLLLIPGAPVCYHLDMLNSLHGLEQFVFGVPAVWLVVVLAMLLLRGRVQRWAAQKAASDASAGDSRAAAVLARVYAPVLVLAGLYSSLELAGPLLPNSRWLDRAEKGLLILTYLVIMALAWRAFSLLVSYWARTNPNAGTLVPPVQLFGRILIVLFTLASIFGDNLPKVWTALGIGSIAVALALQETLSNTFAGFHLMLDQPIRIGDYIKVESGEEGRVMQIGWRSTRLVSPANNILVIPNAKLARASITNYTLPEPRLGISVTVSVACGCDTRRVAAVLEELARTAAAEIDGMLADPPPSVRFIPGFGDWSLNFSLYCQVRDFAAQTAVQDELRHRIVERFREEGIAMAFPVREVHIKSESASAGS